jgi:hypothetical protein
MEGVDVIGSKVVPGSASDGRGSGEIRIRSRSGVGYASIFLFHFNNIFQQRTEILSLAADVLIMDLGVFSHR